MAGWYMLVHGNNITWVFILSVLVDSSRFSCSQYLQTMMYSHLFIWLKIPGLIQEVLCLLSCLPFPLLFPERTWPVVSVLKKSRNSWLNDWEIWWKCMRKEKVQKQCRIFIQILDLTFSYPPPIKIKNIHKLKILFSTIYLSTCLNIYMHSIIQHM